MHPAAGTEERQAAGNMAASLSKRSADKDIDPPGHPIKGWPKQEKDGNRKGIGNSISVFRGKLQ